MDRIPKTGPLPKNYNPEKAFVGVKKQQLCQKTIEVGENTVQLFFRISRRSRRRPSWCETSHGNFCLWNSSKNLVVTEHNLR